MCTNSKVNIDEARQELFTMKGQSMDAIPPARAALLQHIRRAMYQGGHCWCKMLQATIGMPSAPWGLGMSQPTKLETYVDHLPEASTASRELIHCGCKKGCTGWCKCKKAAFNFKINELLIVNSLH